MLIIAISGQVMLTANQPRSGTHHFHPDRPSCPLHCGRHEVRFVSEADVYKISFVFANAKQVNTSKKFRLFL